MKVGNQSAKSVCEEACIHLVSCHWKMPDSQWQATIVDKSAPKPAFQHVDAS